MKIVTTAQMRELEGRAVEAGVPVTQLMEKAGLAVAREVLKLAGDVSGRRILVLIGPGNNGGDGLVAARHLHDWGAKVSLCLFAPRPEGDPNLALVERRSIPYFVAAEGQGLAVIAPAAASSSIIVDAVLGTGKPRPIAGALAAVLALVAQARRRDPVMRIVALDLPSGLNADTGDMDPATLYADLTVTLGYPKTGLFLFPGAERAGRLVVSDIGIPAALGEGIRTELITAGWARAALPHRPAAAYKGTFGRLLVVGGSVNYIGAAYLACMGALRVGAGLVTLATGRTLQSVLAAKLAEVIYSPLAEEQDGVIAAYAAASLREQVAASDVMLVGCGLGQRAPTAEFARSLLFGLPAEKAPALVLDADALNILSHLPHWWEKLPADAVLTPHPGEMCRLSGLSIGEVQADRLGVARSMAAQWRKTIVLKGACTIIAAPDGRIMVSGAANPGLASAGTGDVLAGVIAGLLAQGLAPFEAAACGVYLHAEAGDMVRRRLGDAGMIASDLLPCLPLAIKRLKEAGTEEGDERCCWQ